MNIKKVIVGLAFSMLLGSEMAAADWGDVYYCQMTNLIKITPEGERTNYKLEKFKFTLSQTKKTMDFGSDGYFNNSSLDLEIGAFFPSQELWYADSSVGIAKFKDGKFFFSSISTKLTAISADCDKF